MIIKTKYNIINTHANIECNGNIRTIYEVWGDTIKEESIIITAKREIKSL